MTESSGKGRTEGLPQLPDDVLLVGPPCLLVIDVQHDFMDTTGSCYNIGAEHTVAPTAELIATFRAHGLPVIFTREVHRPNLIDAGLEADRHYHVPPHTVEGTIGVEIVDSLAPRPGEFVVDKRRYSCFLGTDSGEHRVPAR